MAGEGSRFVKAGYDIPKPFIDVHGKPMIIRVLENLFYPDARYILIARKEHMEKESELVVSIEKEYNAKFISIEKLTEGTACTVLHARRIINNDEPLLVANSDQIVDISIEDFIGDCFERKLNGSILTFVDPHKDTKWSFARIDKNKLVTEVQEKVPISNYATVGIYLFARGRDYVDSAIDMIIGNDRINNEFYTCPTYNYAIKNGKKIGIFNIKFEEMHGLGTPEDLDFYLDAVVI